VRRGAKIILLSEN